MAASRVRIPCVALLGYVPSVFRSWHVWHFGTSHVRHDLLSATSISGEYFRTSVGMRGSAQTKRGRGMRATPVLLRLWVVLADHGTCFVF